MYKTILISFFLLIAIFANAQNSFHVSTTYATKQGQVDKEVAPSISIRNLTNSTIELRWEIKKNNLSEGWQAIVCDHQCYTSLITNKTFKLEPGEILHDFKVSFRPNGKEGIGNLEIAIYDTNKKNSEQSISFSASAQNLTSSSFPAESVDAKVFPNPAIEYIQLQDDYNRVKYIEVYNVIGRKIDKFTVNYAGEKYDVSNLPKGIYMVSMLDANRNVLRTQRISKYAP